MPDLIRTKLHNPSIPSNIIAQPRLFKRLTKTLSPKLVLVSAPAGFGKSTIISNWVEQSGQPCSWLTLDPSDNDPARFWKYLLSALQNAGISPNAGMLHMLDIENVTLATTLINELVDHSGPVIMALDDFHHISEPSIHNAMQLLLDHMPEGVTLVLMTRADPPFSLGRLRAHGEMLELRAADLRFTLPETTDFLHNVMGLPLDNDKVVTLHRRTEGWPAGLHLAALAIRDHTDPVTFIEQFAGSHRYIVEYLTEEVISQQSDDVQRFLLETAILDRLHPSLCTAVTGRTDSDTMLQHLYQKNLFLITLDPTHLWYRYHHLFADLLRYRQRQQLATDLIRNLYERASDWYNHTGQTHEAVEYALRGAIYSKVARLIEDNWHHILHQGEINTMRRWLNVIPDHLIASSAPLNMAYCWLHYLGGATDKVEVWLTAAQQAWQTYKARDTVPQREAWLVIPSLIKTMSAIVALQRDNARAALELAQQALDLVPTDERVNHDLLIGSASYRLAQAHRQLGQFEEAINTLLPVIEQLKRTDNVIGIVRGVHEAVQLYLALEQPATAQAVCEDSLDHLTQRGYARLPLIGLIHTAQAEISLCTNDATAAKMHLEKAQAVAGNSRYSPLLERIETLQSQLNAMTSQGSPLAELLTTREMEVLNLLSIGYSNQQIAEALVITEDTVKRHNTHIYGKLNVSNRTQAVLRAQELGLL